MKSPKGKAIIMSMLQKAMDARMPGIEIGESMTGSLMRVGGSFTFLRLVNMGMMGNGVTKEQILALNDLLNTIPKE